MKPGEVTRIPVENIQPNPHNPRRLFDEEPMRILKESIENVGVLVPITVYPEETKEEFDPIVDQFILLDGERRWRCVKDLQRDTIPAIIVEKPTETQNILTMFHIHNMRESWMLMPTALKLKILIQKLGETNEIKLAELTKLSISQIRRCKILLTYPKRFQNLLLAPPSDRLKADFFIDLQRIRGPALDNKYSFWMNRGDEKCIDIFLKKYLNGVIVSVTAPRIIAEIYRGSIRTNQLPKFKSEMDRFLENPKMTVDEINVPEATFEKEFKKIRSSVRRLNNQLMRLDVEVLSADQEMVDLLNELLDLIQKKLVDALVTKPEEIENESS